MMFHKFHILYENLVHLFVTISEQDQSLEIKYKHKKSSSKEKHSSHKHSSDREFRSRDVKFHFGFADYYCLSAMQTS